MDSLLCYRRKQRSGGCYPSTEEGTRLFLFSLQILNIDRLFHDLTALDGGLGECLSLPEFLNYTCLFKFPFELLQCPFNVFAFFNWYYYHVVFVY
jgi:hypothetical protein